MSRPTTMTCRVRGVSFDDSPFLPAFPYEEAQITLQPPFARRRASIIAQNASRKTRAAVFFVETRNKTLWVNKDIWYDGNQYEIVGDIIPGLPLSIRHTTLIEA